MTREPRVAGPGSALHAWLEGEVRAGEFEIIPPADWTGPITANYPADFESCSFLVQYGTGYPLNICKGPYGLTS